MNIGIIGYGRMGKRIHVLAKEKKHVVEHIVDVHDGSIEKGPEVYIDFSSAEAVKKNIQTCIAIHTPIIIGTTGWDEDFDEVERMVQEGGIRVIYSSNFSLGVNLFWSIVASATDTIGEFSDMYDVMIHEFHHRNKIDSPSGTAKETARIVLEKHPIKQGVVQDALQRKIKKSEMHVTSTRGGSIPGTHSVLFDGDVDTIEIKHTARNQDGFALGALHAAELIRGVEPGLHNFKSIML